MLFKTSRPALLQSDVKGASEDSNGKEEMSTNTTTTTAAAVEELRATSTAKNRYFWVPFYIINFKKLQFLHRQWLLLHWKSSKFFVDVTLKRKYRITSNLRILVQCFFMRRILTFIHWIRFSIACPENPDWNSFRCLTRRDPPICQSRSRPGANSTQFFAVSSTNRVEPNVPDVLKIAET